MPSGSQLRINVREKHDQNATICIHNAFISVICKSFIISLGLGESDVDKFDKQ